MTERNLAFNVDAVYGSNTGSAFLNGGRGLVDSIHRVDDFVFKKFKVLKKQDWDENENPLEQMRSDFLSWPKEGEMFKNNVGWQWGGDSIAANTIVPMFAPFMPDTDTWLWLSRQGDNENLHALSYSEIVKIAVPDGEREIARIHQSQETIRRMLYVTKIFNHVIRVGAKITLGEIDYRSQEASDALMLGLCGVFILERCQFMPSFLNTAILSGDNKFVPGCSTIRKIAIDEYGCHIPAVRYIIQKELQTKERRESLERMRPILANLLIEVTNNEVAWNEMQFRIGGEQLGMTEQMGADYAYYASTDVANELGLKTDLKIVTRNPAPIMDNFLNLNRERKASMEEKGGNYQTVAVATSTITVDTFDLDGI